MAKHPTSTPLRKWEDSKQTWALHGALQCKCQLELISHNLFNYMILNSFILFNV
jgi:hypothetical protein